MTVRVWSWRQAIQQSHLGSTTKLVLFNLSIYMNDLGEGCFPSVRRQVADTGLSERAVYAALASAEKAGFLRRSKLRRYGVEQNEYAASYPAEEPPAGGAGVHLVQPPPAPGAGAPLQVVHPNSPGEPPKEHSTPPPIPSKRRTVPLEDVTLERNAEWLAEQRRHDRYLRHDERFILDYFRNYCASSGKVYKDHLAAYRNAFEWKDCQPKESRHAQPNPRQHRPVSRHTDFASQDYRANTDGFIVE